VGIIKGRVETINGQPVAKVRVIGFPPQNIAGGLVYAVSDDHGRFILTYHGEGPLDYVEVDGGERQNHVNSGADIVLVRHA
jgi:hypothetical protein